MRYVEEVEGGKRIIPMIEFADGSRLFEPTDHELAEKLGIELRATHSPYDLVIAGGGPAGLTAAIYAAREGIETLVVDKGSLGGQATITERIENYPGFPSGIGGGELVDNFVAQARKLGVELLPATGVTKLRRSDGDIEVDLSNGQEICSHAVILAVGSTYRRLGVPGEDRLIGSGVHFCATCDGPFYRGAEELVVIGGGNSAFEEAFFLLRFADHVTILERSSTPKASRLLQEKAAREPRIDVLTDIEVVELKGDGALKELVAIDRSSQKEISLHPKAAFVFIGMQPNTEFLRGVVDLDERGFIKTGPNLETSIEGVFAAGDARAGSTKQIASAVGEGATALLMVRDYLRRHDHIATHGY